MAKVLNLLTIGHHMTSVSPALSGEESLDYVMNLILCENPDILILNFQIRAYKFEIEDLLSILFKEKYRQRIIGMTCCVDSSDCPSTKMAHLFANKVHAKYCEHTIDELIKQLS